MKQIYIDVFLALTNENNFQHKTADNSNISTHQYIYHLYIVTHYNVCLLSRTSCTFF